MCRVIGLLPSLLFLGVTSEMSSYLGSILVIILMSFYMDMPTVLPKDRKASV